MTRKFRNLNVNYQISCIAEFFWREDVKKLENQKSYLQKLWGSSFLIQKLSYKNFTKKF